MGKKISQFATITTVASGDYFPVVQASDTSNKRASLASLSTSLQFTQAGTDATARTIDSKLKDVVSVKDFGAVGDGVTDDTVAIQAAINRIGIYPGAELYFPAGIYRITAPLTWNKSIRLKGAAKGGDGGESTVTIKATAAMTAVIQASTAEGDTDLTSRSHFDGINIHCNSLANYGYLGTTNHTTFENLRVYGALVAGMSISYGWCNLFHNLELSYNSGDGLVLGNQSNQALVQHLKSFANTGWGCKLVGSSYSVKIVSSVLETCQKGGLWIGPGIQGFSIDCCYFEANASTGYTFTSPISYLVKADIVTNGTGTETAIAGAFLSTGSITDCFTSPSADQACFIFGNGLGGTTIRNNRRNTSYSTAFELIRYFGNNSVSSSSLSYGSPNDLQVLSNTNFTDFVVIDTANYSTYAVSYELCNSTIFGSPSQNIGETELNQWYLWASAGGGTFQRSSTKFDFNPNVPVWEISHNANSDIYGFQINASDCPKYHNKWMVFSFWAKCSFSGDGGIVVYANGSASSSYETTGAEWRLKSAMFKMPTSGTISFGIRIILNAVTKTAQIAAPVLCQFGGDWNALWGAYQKQTQFLYYAAPTTGTWKLGDVVVNTSPSAGGVPGWVCVTAGTPGTWKSMAALAA
jgi:hypothetical protein